MKKHILLLTAMACMALLLASCSQNAAAPASHGSSHPLVADENSQQPRADNLEGTIPEQGKSTETKEDAWGIQLTTAKIIPTGLTLLCQQSGGQPTGALQTGSPYWLEIQIDNQWIPVDMLPSEYERAWTGEAWIIPMKDSTEWEVNWTGLYGQLPAGDYRIGKEIMDFRGSGDYDVNAYYANFEVVD